jgi:GNAT superfamily N-acetyltransferase
VTTPTVVLRPITDSEYEGWRNHAVSTFAAGIGPARGLDPDEGLEFARKETDRLLPDGPATENHLIWTACSGEEQVGSLWIFLGPRVPFVFGIEVDSGHRGRGFGRAIMLAGEAQCRDRGYAQLDLNVFANNPTAISLYESLGYEVVSQQMRKRL